MRRCAPWHRDSCCVAMTNWEHGVERLRAALASGAWHARHGELLAHDELDAGYRLLVTQSG